jgi:hypothetical protein
MIRLPHNKGARPLTRKHFFQEPIDVAIKKENYCYYVGLRAWNGRFQLHLFFLVCSCGFHRALMVKAQKVKLSKQLTRARGCKKSPTDHQAFF